MNRKPESELQSCIVQSPFHQRGVQAYRRHLPSGAVPTLDHQLLLGLGGWLCQLPSPAGVAWSLVGWAVRLV